MRMIAEEVTVRKHGRRLIDLEFEVETALHRVVQRPHPQFVVRILRRMSYANRVLWLIRSSIDPAYSSDM